MEDFENKVKKVIYDFMDCKEELQFVSEKDFQVGLAIALKNSGMDVICEYPYRTFVEYPPYDKESDDKEPIDSQGYIDIVVKDGENIFPIELKYRKKSGIQIKGVELKNQGAHDAGCYGYLRDICRIMEFVNQSDKCIGGMAIFLTNDKKYKNEYSGKNEDGKSYANFWLGSHQDQDVTYGPRIGDNGKTYGRVNGKLRRLNIPKTIGNANWKEWKENGEFIYKIIEVTSEVGDG